MKRFLHNFSHEHLTTLNQGEFIPFLAFTAIPNETIRLDADILLRTQPLLAPAYAKCKATISYYAVPIRQLFAQFPEFRSGGPNGDAAIEHPYVTSPVGGFLSGSLMDRLGSGVGDAGNKYNALYPRAVNHVWNTFIRDKDLQSERVFSTGSGSDTTTDLTLPSICWEKNNFTTARPTPQQGTAVSIPISGQFPIEGIGFVGTTSGSGAAAARETVDTVAYPFGVGGSALATNLVVKSSANSASARPEIYADASSSGVSIPVEEIRRSSAIQRFKEDMMKFVGGGTLPEFYRLFGVAPQDSRMQWPEYLGGGTSVIQFSEVLQTAEGTDPVGELRGHGIGVAKSRRIVYRTQEDCIILGFLTVKPKTVYMDAVPKMMIGDLSRWDYFLPQLQNLGQQPVLNREVYSRHTTPNGVFGYQDHNYFHRRCESRVSGEFRDTLKFWHMGIEYDVSPALNGTFVESVPTDRIYAVGGAAAQLQVRIWNNVKRKNQVLPMGRPAIK